MKSCCYWSHHKIKWNDILQSLRKKEKKVRHIIYVRGIWDKVIDFTDEPVVQCDVPAVRNISLGDDDNNNCKKLLMGIHNLLFLELILSLVLVS